MKIFISVLFFIGISVLTKIGYDRSKARQAEYAMILKMANDNIKQLEKLQVNAEKLSKEANLLSKQAEENYHKFKKERATNCIALKKEDKTCLNVLPQSFCTKFKKIVAEQCSDAG